MYRLKTLGGALIEGPAGPLTGATSQRRRLAVLSLLAASGNGISRDRLVALLWPESDEERARHALSQLLYSLRRDLGQDAVTSSATALRLEPSIVTSDIADFREAFARRAFERAVELYGGPFLDGFHLTGCPEFERWVEAERSNLQHDVRRALEQLARQAEERADAREAVRWWGRRAALDPLDSGVTLALMGAMAEAGDRAGALRHARIHETLLRDQLEAEPDPRIAELVTELNATATAGTGGAGARRASATARADAVAEVEAAAASGTGVPAAGPADQPHAGVGSPSGRRLRPVLLASVAALAVSLIVLGARLLAFAPAAGDRDWIVMADVENASGVATFENSVSLALAVGLSQSPGAWVLPPARIHQTLARMRLPAVDARLDENLARDIARREGARFVVVPMVTRAGDGYEISARLVDPASASVLSLITVRVERAEQAMDGLDRLARGLRRAIGESALAVTFRSQPLPRVTSASLEAVEKFAAGNRAFAHGRYRESQMLWAEAVAIDSQFASAFAALGAHAYWTNQPSAAEAWYTRALAHLDGLPARERALIRADMESWRGNREEAVALRQTFLAQHPDDIEMLKLLGYDHLRLGRNHESRDVFRRVIAVDSLDHLTWINLATVEKGLQDYDSALVHYRRAFALLPSMETENSNVNHEFGATYVYIDALDSAAAVFSRMLPGDRSARARGLRSLAFLDMYQGRYGQASRHLAEAVHLSRLSGAATSEVRNRLLLATSLGQEGREGAAAAQLDSAWALASSIDLDPVLAYWLGKALARTGDVRRPQLLLDTLEARKQSASPTGHAAAEGLRGELWVARGEAARALPHLENALRADSSKITLESLAHAVSRTPDLERAASLYAQLAHDPNFGHEAQEHWRMATYWQGRVAERRGEAAAASRSYERFLEAWRDAEPSLPVLTDARDRLLRLRAEGAGPR